MFGTYLSKVVCVLLIVWTILREKKRIESGCVFSLKAPERDHSCTHNVAVVRFGHQQHPADQICGWHSLGSLALPATTQHTGRERLGNKHDIHKRAHIFSRGDSPVPPRLLHLFVCVFPIHCECYIIWNDSTHDTLLASATNRIQNQWSDQPCSWLLICYWYMWRYTSVHAEVTVVLVEGPEGGDVRGSFHNLIHPLYGPDHLVSLRLSEDGRALVLRNLTLKRRADTG